jgi:hypothetical protein
MTIYLILIGIVMCSIIVTSLQMKLQIRKEMNELNQLFNDVPEVSD